MKKALGLIAVMAVLLLAACNRNDEPPVEVRLPIYSSFLPTTMSLQKSDTETYEKCLEWNHKILRVDSTADLPDDPLGFSDAYRNLNLTNSTLLLYYTFHFWNIESLDYTFIRNRVEGTYNWNMSIGVTDVVFEGDEVPDSRFFTRLALLVRKLPEDAKVQIWYSLNDLDGTTDWFE